MRIRAAGESRPSPTTSTVTYRQPAASESYNMRALHTLAQDCVPLPGQRICALQTSGVDNSSRQRSSLERLWTFHASLHKKTTPPGFVGCDLPTGVFEVILPYSSLRNLWAAR